MNTVDRLMCEEFARRFGQTPAPPAQSIGNYSCCDECRDRCERLEATDLESPRSGAVVYENRMGTKAYEFIFPSLVRAALTDRADDFTLLAHNLNYARYREFSEQQRDAIEFILEYCRSSGYGSAPEQARVSEALGFLAELREHGCLPWEESTSSEAMVEAEQAGGSDA
ncbi:MAG: hypothetical protein H7A48_05985 [Akkermansiaceae bacterium]|nr:hypothetical protein [Akkermansiaceae bacterium]MCP5548689.1 hypothetical protein [Akkermansiaceae bacterium]